MQMKYRLAGFRSDVQHGTVSVFDPSLSCDLGGGQMASADDFGIFFGTTNTCVGAFGSRSSKAYVCSSSCTFFEGISPAMILQKRQSFISRTSSSGYWPVISDEP